MPDFASALDNLQSRAGACGLRVSPLMVSCRAPDGEPWPQSEPLPRSVREQRSCARLDVQRCSVLPGARQARTADKHLGVGLLAPLACKGSDARMETMRAHKRGIGIDHHSVHFITHQSFAFY